MSLNQMNNAERARFLIGKVILEHLTKGVTSEHSAAVLAWLDNDLSDDEERLVSVETGLILNAALADELSASPPPYKGRTEDGDDIPI